MMDPSSNHDAPWISVIVAARNAEATLERCLTSLEDNLGELPRHLVEVVFVDGASTDRTAEIFAWRDCSARGFACRHRRAPRGVSHAYNTGVLSARGRHTLFLNADDEWSRGYLAAVARALREAERGHPGEHVVVYTAIQFINEAGQELFQRRPPLYFDWVQRRQSVILHPNASYPTALLRRYPFPVYDDLRPADQEQVARLMREARPVRLPQAVYRYRIWSDSGTVTRARRPEHSSKPAWDRALDLLCRVYVQSFETRLFGRAWRRLRHGETCWRDSAAMGLTPRLGRGGCQ